MHNHLIVRPMRGGGKGAYRSHDHDHSGVWGHLELAFAIICGLFLLTGFVASHFGGKGAGWLVFPCYLLAYGFGGFFAAGEVIGDLRRHRFKIDTLMLVAAGGAAVLGSWAEGALLLFLFSLGHSLEHYAMGRAKSAITALGTLTPEMATLRQSDGTVSEVHVSALSIGDVILIRPNTTIAADGFVIAGNSVVNQAPVTGESVPVDKSAVPDRANARGKPDQLDIAHRVFAGTINGSGLLEVEVTRLAGDSVLSRLARLVSEAKARRSPAQNFAVRFERVFVPIILASAVALLFAWVVLDELPGDSFYRSMAFLVAASPCALAIATPSAILAGIARAAHGGVLVKGGAPLELLGSVNVMAFDKTGTLTAGVPRIEQIVTAPGVTQQELMAVAVAVEELSDHPLARAIARDGREYMGDHPAFVAQDLKNHTGQGVSASIGDDIVLIGKAEMFETGGAPPLGEAMRGAAGPLYRDGLTLMFVRYGNRDLGAIGLMDTPRDTARPALERLRALGIHRTIMLSGDHQRVVDMVARQVGIDEARGDLMPEDKVRAIEGICANNPVAMVGDGVNDVPAMAAATVSVAMGAAGTDVVLDTADVALMTDDLSHLPFAVELSRKARSTIRQNLFASLGMVVFLIPATLFGLGIGPAIILHEGSTLLVVFNALRLLAFKDQAEARPSAEILRQRSVPSRQSAG